MSLNSVSTFASCAPTHNTAKVFGGFPPCHKSSSPSSSSSLVAPVQPSTSPAAASAAAVRRSSLYWNTPSVKPGMISPM